MGHSEAFYEFHIGVRLVVGPLLHLLLQAVHLSLHLIDIGKSLACLFADGGIVLQIHYLGQIAYSTVVRH